MGTANRHLSVQPLMSGSSTCCSAAANLTSATAATRQQPLSLHTTLTNTTAADKASPGVDYKGLTVYEPIWLVLTIRLTPRASSVKTRPALWRTAAQRQQQIQESTLAVRSDT